MSDSVTSKEIHTNIVESLTYIRKCGEEPQVLLCSTEAADKLGVFITNDYSKKAVFDLSKTGVYGLDVYIDDRFECPRVLYGSCFDVTDL